DGRAMAADARCNGNAPDSNRDLVALARPSRLQAAPTDLFRLSFAVMCNQHFGHEDLGNSPGSLGTGGKQRVLGFAIA
ncbi:MAG: hypothetical protein WAW37_18480, partial [Syntrophobacteraceae bacterium]